ncbi:MAG: hypothetical protein WCG83_05190 [Candidatus Peregrinibacteria bacterium]
MDNSLNISKYTEQDLQRLELEQLKNPEDAVQRVRMANIAINAAVKSAGAESEFGTLSLDASSSNQSIRKLAGNFRTKREPYAQLSRLFAKAKDNGRNIDRDAITKAEVMIKEDLEKISLHEWETAKEALPNIRLISDNAIGIFTEMLDLFNLIKDPAQAELRGITKREKPRLLIRISEKLKSMENDFPVMGLELHMLQTRQPEKDIIDRVLLLKKEGAKMMKFKAEFEKEYSKIQN